MNRAWCFLLALCTAISHADQNPAPPKLNWYRGNTHAHTLNADGNAAPDTVARWYREHGYQFLVLTEHEYIADVEPLNALLGAKERFLVLPGQEVTQILSDPTHPEGWRHAHVNGIGLNRLVMPIGSSEHKLVAHGMTMSESYKRNIAAIRSAGAIPQVNHPNGRWSVRPSDLAELSGVFLLEIWNGNPKSNNFGGTNDAGETAPSTEGFWDMVLSQGKTAWGVASDDSHDFVNLDNLASERPGRAWIVVRAPELTQKALMDAMLSGNFYASTGVTLQDYSADRNEVRITIKQPHDPRHSDDSRFMTRFIGKNGTLLAEVPGRNPIYRIRGDEGYVRASILDSNGLRAWTQPLFVN